MKEKFIIANRRKLNTEKNIILKQMSKDPNVESVIELIKARSEKGLKEYGTDTTRQDYNALDWLNEAQAEALDLAIYLEVIKKDYVKFKELIKSTPNDKILGGKIRKIYG